MTVLEVVLLTIGVVMMIASFFLTEKLSNKDLEKISELSTEEMRRILEKSLNEAQVKVNNMVDQVIDQSIDKSMDIVERALDKETNEKMRAISEYSDTVLEAIHKTHNEVMFLYSMLNDKHSELTNYAGNLADLAIHLEELQTDIQQSTGKAEDLLQRLKDSLDAPVPALAAPKRQAPSQAPAPEAAEETPEPQAEEVPNHNQMILERYREGKSAVEIAKELGIGVGEVRLVIGLFREEDA